MREDRSKDGSFRRGAILGIALVLFALGGCAESSAPTAAKQNSGAQASAAMDTPASAKSRISKLCMLDPDKFFGGANNQARCDCYGEGVAKTLNKDELGYLATYNEIPSISANEYDKIKERCLAGGAPAPDKKPAKKDAASPAKDKS
jgi:hypothetical protein